jgi:gluconate 2-dehydrogenase gamma chain
MIDEELTRRIFLQGSGSVAGSILARAGLPAFIAATQSACMARDEGAAFENITSAEAREFEAITSRILPTTDTPGAREAGVIWFIDKTYGSIYAEFLANDRVMLADFQSGVAAIFSGAELFSDLDEADQDNYLRSRERTEFFETVRFKTMAGVFGLNSWGGNQNDVGWKLVGMDGPPHAWSYPFGYYDAEYAKEQQNGE